ncbi:MAG TPA: SurA N-terminal domain-containing protein, partial [Nitrospinota bacterium]|nr:SurA N-terminal domain-containing protein [Nitrospinota bacterium]
MIGLSSVLRVVGFGSLMAFAAAGGLRAPSARAVVIDRIVAVVNKDIITLSQVQEAGRGEFSQLQQRYNGRRLKREIERVQRKYLDLLITRRLRVNRAKEMELSFTDAEVDRALEDVKKRNNISDSELEVLLKREGMTIPEYRERVGEEILLRKVMNIEVRSRVSVPPREIKAYY